MTYALIFLFVFFASYLVWFVVNLKKVHKKTLARFDPMEFNDQANNIKTKS